MTAPDVFDPRVFAQGLSHDEFPLLKWTNRVIGYQDPERRAVS
jgi:hypothetical protein